MTTRITKKYIYIFLLFNLLFIAGSGCFFHRGVRVAVTNNSGSIIRNFLLNYAGGSIEANVIDYKKTISYKVKPTSESDLRIQFLDKDGNTKKATIEVYIEPNYGGRIKIIIGPDYNLIINNCSAPYIYLSRRLLWFLNLGCSHARAINQ